MKTLLLLLVSLLTSHVSRAAELSAEPLTQDLRLRAGGAIALEVAFTNNSPRILEGRLEATLLDRDQRLAVHLSPELVLQPGRRTVPLLLPPPAEVMSGDSIAVRLRWVGKEASVALGDHHLGTYGLSGEEVVLAVLRTGRRLTEQDNDRERALRIETLAPKGLAWGGMTTLPAPLPVEAAPLSPLGWCAYDAVFVDGAAFAALSEKQLAALRRWVEGGGALWLAADVSVQARHGEFVAALADGTVPALGEDGRISPPREPWVLRPGLGVVVMASKAPGKRDDAKPWRPGAPVEKKELEAKRWRAAVAELWKFPANQVAYIQANGEWEKTWMRNRGAAVGDEFLDMQNLWQTVSGLNSLRPDAPATIPVAVIATVIAVLLVCVGPVDFLVLGWLRRRRWTWVVFPMCCVLCAWWISRDATRRIGRDDRRGTVRFIDVARDGRVLREIRYEFLLPARDYEWVLPLDDALAVPVSRVPMDDFLPAGQGLGVTTPHNAFANDATYAWTSPGRGRMTRSLRQWTPAMVRLTSFPVDARDDSGVQWDLVGSRREWIEVVPPGMSLWGRGMQERGYPAVYPAVLMREERPVAKGHAPTLSGTLIEAADADCKDDRGYTSYHLAWRQEGNVMTIYRRFVAPRQP